MDLDLDKLREAGFNVPADVIRAELVQGRDDLRHQAQDECPVCGEPDGYCVGLLYLQTDRGTTYGGAGHAGYLCLVHLNCAPEPWGINRGDYRYHDSKVICADCLSAGGADYLPDELVFYTPRQNQGQIVTVSYALDLDDNQRVYRRSHDASDDSICYEVGHLADSEEERDSDYWDRVPETQDDWEEVYGPAEKPGPCWSCLDMARETEADNARERAAKEAR